MPKVYFLNDVSNLCKIGVNRCFIILTIYIPWSEPNDFDKMLDDYLRDYVSKKSQVGDIGTIFRPV